MNNLDDDVEIIGGGSPTAEKTEEIVKRKDFQIKDLKEQNSKLTLDTQNLQQNLEHAESKYNTANQSARKLQVELIDVQEQLTKALHEHTKKQTEFKTQLEKAENLRTQLENDVSQLKKKIESQNSSEGNQIKDLEKQLANFKSQVEKDQKVLEEKTKTITEFNQIMDEMDQQSKESEKNLNDKLIAQDQELQELTLQKDQEIDNLQKDLEKAQTSQQTGAVNDEALQKAFENSEKENEEYRKIVKETGEKLSQKNWDIQQLEAEIANLQQTTSSSSNSLIEEINQLKGREASLMQEIQAKDIVIENMKKNPSSGKVENNEEIQLLKERILIYEMELKEAQANNNHKGDKEEKITIDNIIQKVFDYIIKEVGVKNQSGDPEQSRTLGIDESQLVLNQFAESLNVFFNAELKHEIK